MSEKTQTWGYDDDGNAQIFELEKGEKLPKGWHDAPAKPEHHPNHPDNPKNRLRVTAGPVKVEAPPEEPPKRRGRPPKDAD